MMTGGFDSYTITPPQQLPPNPWAGGTWYRFASQSARRMMDRLNRKARRG